MMLAPATSCGVGDLDRRDWLGSTLRLQLSALFPLRRHVGPNQFISGVLYVNALPPLIVTIKSVPWWFLYISL